MNARATPVITGLGVVSAFGLTLEDFALGLQQGRGAISGIEWFDVQNFPVKIAGEVKLNPFPALLKSQKSRAVFRDRKSIFGYLAAHEAWTSACCGTEQARAPLVIALGLEQAFLGDFIPLMKNGMIDWNAEATADLPEIRFRSPVDLCAQVVSESLGLQGEKIINSSACAAGSMAVAQAASLIERGEYELILCGAADSMVNPLGMGGMYKLGAPSPRSEPDACRPFDRKRDGLVIGEGAAFFVIESEASAKKRGVRPLAKILGWATTQDGYRVTAPRPDGSAAARSMSNALKKAGLMPTDIDHINAHGTGTPLNDLAESKAIRNVFGVEADRIWVSSIKGAVGHLMAASGGIELAAAVLSLDRGFVPGTAHHREKDPECLIRVVGEKPILASDTFPLRTVLSNSFGFGGQNCSVILGKP